MMLNRYEIDLMARTERVRKETREETIEECARVVESFKADEYRYLIAENIRALKDKP